MHYYHYLSGSKVATLFPQLPAAFLDGVKVELGFDFGLLKGKLAGEHRDPSTLVAQVQAVEKYFEREELIHAAITEGTWLRGTFIGRAGSLPGYEGLVLFGGRFGNTTLLLAGSESNLVSGAANPGKNMGWSFMPRTLHSLKKYLEQDMDLLDLENQGTSYPGSVAQSYIFHSNNKITGSLWRAFHSMPEHSLPEPSFQMSFLARIFLVRTNANGESLALGSPLYIAE